MMRGRCELVGSGYWINPATLQETVRTCPDYPGEGKKSQVPGSLFTRASGICTGYGWYDANKKVTVEAGLMCPAHQVTTGYLR